MYLIIGFWLGVAVTMVINWVVKKDEIKEQEDEFKRGVKKANERIEPLIRQIHDLVAEQAYKSGVTDTVDKSIEILKEYPTVTAMGKIKELKEQKND